MGWYALDPLQEALDETKGFLWPFDASRWLRLAVIVFFAGGSGGGFGSGLNNASQGFGESYGEGTAANASLQEFERTVTEALSDPEVVSLLVIAAALILGLVVVFSYLSAVFEFVFYRVLIDEDVRILGPFRRFAVDGLKYMLFRLTLLAVMFGGLAGVIAAFVADPGLALLLLPVLIVFWLLIAVIGFFVKTLAIPTMVREGTGFIEALKIAGGQVRAEWKQAGVFLLTNLVVTIAAGIVVSIGLIVAVIGLAIPLAIIGLPLAAISEVLVAIPIVLGLIGLLVAWALLAVPVQTYVYHWILDVHAGFADAA